MKRKTLSLIRIAVLILIIIDITFEAYMHQVKGGGPEGSPSIHALCPFGGLESLLSVFTAGQLLDKIYAGTMALFIISVVLAVVLRRSFCAWICPLGGLQELFGRAGRKIFNKSFKVPVSADRYLRYLKYLVLALVLILTWKTATLWFSPYDPWAAYGHLGEGLASVWTEFAIGFIILLVSFAGSFFYDRFFCKYMCPMGAFLGIVSKLSPFRIKRSEAICINCNLCTKVCPVNIDVARVETVKSAECINCQECTSVCPKDGALVNEFSIAKGRTVKPLVIGLVTLVIFFGGIGISKLTGSYALLPQPITEETVITDVDSLKGYMTIREISTAMGMALDEVYRRMEIPENISADTTMKDVSGMIDGFEFHTAREKLK